MNNDINSHDYKPRFSFFRTGNEKENEKKLLVGFELEVENVEDNISCKTLIKGISEIINTEDKQFLYYKYDGSLNDGVEIVSMPFSLNYIRENRDKIQEVFKYIVNEGFRSHEPNTCGLHFHINKEYFGNTSKEVEENIDKLILFTEYYKNKLITFSRRDTFTYCHFLGDERHLTNEERLNILKVKKEKFNVDRYMVVNIENSKTVEFRLIRGTLNFNTFMASVEFIFNIARVIKNNKITDISWNDVINYEDSEFLPQYCKEKNIEPDAEKMKDYSIEFLKKQNKLKFELQKIDRELIVTVYDFLLKNTNSVSEEYIKLFNKLPQKYSKRINPIILMDKYKNVNELVIINQYLIDIINNFPTNKQDSFMYCIKKFLNEFKYSPKLKNRINKIDKEFLDFITKELEKREKIAAKIEIVNDGDAIPF